MKMRLILIALIALVWSCASEEKVNTETESTPKEQEWSELALLMRQIHIDAKDWKAQIEADELVLDTVAIYEALVTSTPTKAEVTGPVFEGFARNYQIAVDEFLQAEDIQLAKSAYNNLVTSCLSCHQEFCPGPMKTIAKLRVSEN